MLLYYLQLCVRQFLGLTEDRQIYVRCGVSSRQIWSDEAESAADEV